CPCEFPNWCERPSGTAQSGDESRSGVGRLFKSHSVHSTSLRGTSSSRFVTLNFKSRFGNAACQQGEQAWQWLTSKAPKGRSRGTWHSRKTAKGPVSWSSTHAGGETTSSRASVTGSRQTDSSRSLPTSTAERPHRLGTRPGTCWQKLL